MITRILVCLLLAAVAGCQSSPQPVPTPPKRATLSPFDAVLKAAEAAPGVAHGTFEFLVQATGEQNGFAYLNSELDYRDQRNLTISIPPATRKVLTEINGSDPKSFYFGKRLQITGDAKRTKIYFYSGGVQSSKYYYQTHLTILDPTQIQIVD